LDRIEELRVFAAVADALSFAKAARRLGISPAQASKLVARLEDRLGARLLNRTTRDVSLTDTGRACQSRARALVDDFDALETSARDADGPRGMLKLSVPVSFGAVELGPALLDFAKAYPAVGLDVSLSDRKVNLVDEGFDAAVRIGELTDSSLVARRLAAVRIVTCASPEYLAAHGEPRAPAELVARSIIIDLNLRDPFVWRFGRGDRRHDLQVDGRLRFSSAHACLAAARAGFGIARVPAFVAADDLRAGRIVPLMRADEPDSVAVHAVYPHARHLAAKVRAFVDFLVHRFAGEPAWHQGWS
jgi:DNA-binding transcriptional LysR family regulator